MKKLFPLLIAFTLLFSFPLPTFAAESNDRQQNTSFEISLEEALALADPADITVQNGITTIPVKLDISEEVYTEVVIKVNNLTRARAKSFSMEGWFRLTSSKEIVSVYGLDGTFEYTGSSATATGSSGYHNPTASGWSGTYNLSDEESDDGSASIIVNYTLKKNGKYNNSASCKAKCSKSGKISFSGDYDESTII